MLPARHSIPDWSKAFDKAGKTSGPLRFLFLSWESGFLICLLTWIIITFASMSVYASSGSHLPLLRQGSQPAVALSASVEC